MQHPINKEVKEQIAWCFQGGWKLLYTTNAKLMPCNMCIGEVTHEHETSLRMVIMFLGLELIRVDLEVVKDTK